MKTYIKVVYPGGTTLAYGMAPDGEIIEAEVWNGVPMWDDAAVVEPARAENETFAEAIIGLVQELDYAYGDEPEGP